MHTVQQFYWYMMSTRLGVGKSVKTRSTSITFFAASVSCNSLLPYMQHTREHTPRGRISKPISSTITGRRVQTQDTPAACASSQECLERDWNDVLFSGRLRNKKGQMVLFNGSPFFSLAAFGYTHTPFVLAGTLSIGSRNAIPTETTPYRP